MITLSFKGFYFGSRKYKSDKGVESITHTFMDGEGSGKSFEVRFDGEVKAARMIPYDWVIKAEFQPGKEFRMFIVADEIIGEAIADKILKRKEVS